MRSLIVLTICVALFGTGLFAQRDSLATKPKVKIGGFGAVSLQTAVLGTGNLKALGSGALGMQFNSFFAGGFASRLEGSFNDENHYIETSQVGVWLGSAVYSNTSVYPIFSIKLAVADVRLSELDESSAANANDNVIFEDKYSLMQFEGGVEVKLVEEARLSFSAVGQFANGLNETDYTTNSDFTSIGIIITLRVGAFNY